MLSNEYGVALNEQGRFAQVCIGEFTLMPETGRHVWKGKGATSAEELAEQVNAALKAVTEFGDPFLTIEVVKLQIADCRFPIVGQSKEEEPLPAPAESVARALRSANRELLSVIEHVALPKKAAA